jgi:hypothetical protein
MDIRFFVLSIHSNQPRDNESNENESTHEIAGVVKTLMPARRLVGFRSLTRQIEDAESPASHKQQECCRELNVFVWRNDSREGPPAEGADWRRPNDQPSNDVHHDAPSALAAVIIVKTNNPAGKNVQNASLNQRPAPAISFPRNKNSNAKDVPPHRSGK